MRRIVSLEANAAEIHAKKRAPGIGGAEIDALRNGGARRTPEKRAALRAIRDRALAAGLEPYVAYGIDEPET